MFKTVIAATAIATAANANINADFMSGFQTGVFIGDFKGFDDYSCPVPQMTDKVENYVNMYNMAKNMMGMKQKSGKGGNLNKNSDPAADVLDRVDLYIDQIGVIMSVMDSEYDGGDFCQGLTMGFEGRQVFQSVAMHAVKETFGNKKSRH